jgi:hypothetical protein
MMRCEGDTFFEKVIHLSEHDSPPASIVALPEAHRHHDVLAIALHRRFHRRIELSHTASHRDELTD